MKNQKSYKKTLAVLIVAVFTNLSMAAFNGQESFAKDSTDVRQVPSRQGYSKHLESLLMKVEEGLKTLDEAITKREARISAHVYRGKYLYERGKYAGAQIEWDQAKSLATHPKLMHHQKEIAKLFERQAEIIYDQASQFYRNKQYPEALANFKEVADIRPDFKKTNYYLEIVPEEQARYLETQEKKRLAKELKLEKKRMAEELKQKQAQVKVPYEQALQLFGNKQYEEASAKFKEVSEILPNFKETRRYVDIIPREKARYLAAVEKKRMAEEVKLKGALVKVPYEEALQLFRDKQYEEASAKFKEVSKILPFYKRTSHYIEIIPQEQEQHLQALERERKAVALRQIQAQAKVPYNQAVELFRDKQFEEAFVKFGEVSKILPDFKKTNRYINIIPQEQEQHLQALEKERKAEELKQERILVRQKEALERKRQAEELKQKQVLARVAYNQASQLYRDKQFPEALAKFQAVSGILPDFKRTNHYLDIIPEKQEQHLQALVREREAEAFRQIQAQTKVPYDQALALFRNKQFPEAFVKFGEVSRILPNFKRTNRYINIIPQEQEQHLQALERKRQAKELKQKQAQAQVPYDQALVLVGNKQYPEAIAKFREVSKILPDFKGTNHHLKITPRKQKRHLQALAREIRAEELRQARAIESERRAEAWRQKRALAAIPYNQAIEFYRNEQYREAVVKFKEVSEIIPKFKRTNHYLNAIRDERRGYDLHASVVE